MRCGCMDAAWSPLSAAIITGEMFGMPYFVVIRERSGGWNWSAPMRRQAEWDAHARFMDALTEERFIVLGGPLGGEDDAARVLHVMDAPDISEIETKLSEDPWTRMSLLTTVSIEPWTILLGKLAPFHDNSPR